MSNVVPFKDPGNTGTSPEVIAAFRRWLDARFHWQERPALKTWDGSKRHQIIALLEMLAAIDHPAAIQAIATAKGWAAAGQVEPDWERLTTW